MADTQLLHVVRCTYGPGANDLREAATEEHLAHLRANRDRLRFAGPMLEDDGVTPAGSHAVIEADRDGAATFIAEEAYNRAGMFDDIEIVRCATSLDNRQTELTTDPDRKVFLCHWKADEGSEAAASTDAGHLTGDGRVRVLDAGPLLSDDGTQGIGGMLMVEADDRADVEALVARDIEHRGLDASTVTIGRWRFGIALSG